MISLVTWVLFQIILLALTLFIGINSFMIFFDLFQGFPQQLFLSLLIALLFTLFFSLFVFAIIHKIARLLMHNEEGILTGRDMALWGITMTCTDTAYFMVNKFFINQIFPAIFYKLFGGKLGKGVAIYARLWDVELIEVGDYTSIGTGCIIGAHAISQGELFTKRIKIGKNCTIVTGAVILPGVTIGDQVIVASNSKIPANRILDSNLIYAGSSVKKIREWHGESPWSNLSKNGE